MVDQKNRFTRDLRWRLYPISGIYVTLRRRYRGGAILIYAVRSCFGRFCHHAVNLDEDRRLTGSIVICLAADWAYFGWIRHLLFYAVMVPHTWR